MSDMRGAFDPRLLDFLDRQQRSLAAYAPGLAGGLTMQPQRVPFRRPQLLVAARGRGHAISVAAVDATDDELRNADLTCDGEDDHVQINAAAAMLATRDPTYAGSIRLSTGSFHVTEPIALTFGINLEGPYDYGSQIYAHDCDGVAIDTIASLRRLYIWNWDATTRTTAGVSSTQSGASIYEAGHVEQCVIGQFGSQLHFQSHRFRVRDNLLWNYVPGDSSGWAMKVLGDLDRCSASGNQVIGGNGFYLQGRFHRIINNEMTIDGTVSVELQGVDGNPAAYCTVALNYLDDGDFILGDDTQLCRIYDNDGFCALTAGGSSHRIRSNKWGDVTNTGSQNRYFDNDEDSFTDTGTGTIRNLDGSANDWNF